LIAVRVDATLSALRGEETGFASSGGRQQMAGGANKQFIDKPEDFVRNHVIDVQASPQKLIDVARDHVNPAWATDAARGRVTNLDTGNSGARAAGVYRFDLVDSGTTGSVAVHGVTRQVKIFELRAWGEKARDFKAVVVPGRNTMATRYETPKHAHPIKAYWAPWDKNTGWSVQLGVDADFFFTQTMDGCTLGISSGANPMVTHANYRRRNDDNKASESRTVRKIRQHHQNAHTTDVDKWLRKGQYAATSAEKTAGYNRLVTALGIRNRVTGQWRFYWQRRQIDARNPAAVQTILQDRLVEIV